MAVSRDARRISPRAETSTLKKHEHNHLHGRGNDGVKQEKNSLVPGHL
jgi:hypothetical protein